jgi:threonine/homoserine/homoserine lactone efflux protein
MQRRLHPDTRCSLSSHNSAVSHRLSGDDDQPQSLLLFGSIVTTLIPPEGPSWLMIVIALQFDVLGVILNAIAALFFSTGPSFAPFKTKASAYPRFSECYFAVSAR